MVRNSETTDENTDTAIAPATEAIAGGRNIGIYSDADLRKVSSFDDAIALAARVLGAERVVDAADEMGNGFTILDDKDKLIDEPFIVMATEFQEGDYKDPETGASLNFATLFLVTEHGDRYIVNDGGSGIYKQIGEWCMRTGQVGGLVVKGGLRRSDYDIEQGTGTTFYLNV